MDVPAFVRELAFADLPADVVIDAQRCLLDLIGVGAAGSTTELARIANDYAASELCGRDREARLLFDGRRASRAGAAFAGASTIDALDAHDGHKLTKGHAGAAVLPALLATIDGARDGEPARAIDGREFLTCLVLGYEIATRAGIALHATVSDYHCSGAWNALGCAAVVARLHALDATTIRHALGAAEYFGPRGQILRVTAAPSMLKDGCGWGAHAGVTAALLAGAGFTGAPAITVEADDARQYFADLGSRWRIREQYMKPYPVCRWAQPAIEAALALASAHDLNADDIDAIAIESFREAVDLGSRRAVPTTTEDAQYSIAFAVAAALVFGRLGADEVGARGLGDPRVQRLAARVGLAEDYELSRRFPAERLACVCITLRDGRRLASEPTPARGDPENPLGDEELRAKYVALAGPVLGAARAARAAANVEALTGDVRALPALIGDVLAPARPQAEG